MVNQSGRDKFSCGEPQVSSAYAFLVFVLGHARHAFLHNGDCASEVDPFLFPGILFKRVVLLEQELPNLEEKENWFNFCRPATRRDLDPAVGLPCSCLPSHHDTCPESSSQDCLSREAGDATVALDCQQISQYSKMVHAQLQVTDIIQITQIGNVAYASTSRDALSPGPWLLFKSLPLLDLLTFFFLSMLSLPFGLDYV